MGKLVSYQGESKEIMLNTLKDIEIAKGKILDRQEKERLQTEKDTKKSNPTNQVCGLVEETGKKDLGTAGTSTEPNKVSSQHVIEAKREKTLVMNQSDILPHRLIEIRNEEDINQYLETVKRNLMTALADENVDVIKLK